MVLPFAVDDDVPLQELGIGAGDETRSSCLVFTFEDELLGLIGIQFRFTFFVDSNKFEAPMSRLVGRETDAPALAFQVCRGFLVAIKQFKAIAFKVKTVDLTAFPVGCGELGIYVDDLGIVGISVIAQLESDFVKVEQFGRSGEGDVGDVGFCLAICN